jgi:hypothetical protein
VWENPVTLILVPGIAGGLILAWLMFRSGRPTSTSVVAGAFERHGFSPDIINMSRIRVAGIGGLGLVAMAAAVAFNVPRIGQTMAIGAVAGAILAGALIALRR